MGRPIVHAPSLASESKYPMNRPREPRTPAEAMAMREGRAKGLPGMEGERSWQGRRRTAEKLVTSRKNLANARENLSAIGEQVGVKMSPGESLPEYHLRVRQAVQAQKIPELKARLEKAEGWAGEIGRMAATERSARMKSEKGRDIAERNLRGTKSILETTEAKKGKATEMIARQTRELSDVKQRLDQMGVKSEIQAQIISEYKRDLDAARGDLELEREARARVGQALNYQLRRTQEVEGRLDANNKLNERSEAKRRAEERARMVEETKQRKIDKERGHELGKEIAKGRKAQADVQRLEQRLRETETQKRQLEEQLMMGGDTTIIQQQLNAIDIRLQQIHQNIEGGGGRVRVGPDGMPFIYNPMIGGGGEGRGGGGAAAAAAAAGPGMIGVSGEQWAALIEALRGREGGTPAAAEDALIQKVRAWQLAGVRSDDMRKLLFKESGIEEEKKKSGSAKFADNLENVGRGVGGMAKGLGFLPGGFANILMAIVLILLIWIVLRVFFPMVP